MVITEQDEQFESSSSSFQTSFHVFVSSIGAILLSNVVFRCVSSLRKTYYVIQKMSKLPGDSLDDHPHPWIANLGKIYQYPLLQVGNTDRFVRDILPMYTLHAHLHGSKGLMQFWIFHPYRLPFIAIPWVQIYDPDMMEYIVGRDAFGKCNKGIATSIAGPLTSPSVLSLDDGLEWKHQRRILSPAFGKMILDQANEAISELLQKYLFPVWDERSRNDSDKQQQDIEASVWMRALTLDALGEVAFSYNFHQLEFLTGTTAKEISSKEDHNESQLADSLHTIVIELMKRCRFPYRKYLPTKEQWEFQKACRIFNGTISQIVTKKVKEQEEELGHTSPTTKSATQSLPKKKRKVTCDLLSQIVTKDENNGQVLSHDDISGNMRVFLFAGHETTTTALSYALWHLASNPQVQKRLQIEIDSIFCKDNDHGETKLPPSCGDLQQLPLLDAVVKETLRLNPAAVVTREALEDITVRNREGEEFELPKGCQIMMHPWVTHRLEFYWEKPNEFIPDRFLCKDNALSPQLKLKRPYMPFSLGPRHCIGYPLALAELKSVLAHVMHRYELQPAPDAKEPYPLFNLSYTPDEVKVRCTKRVHN